MITFLALKHFCIHSKPFTIKHYTSILLSIKIHYMLPIQCFKEQAQLPTNCLTISLRLSPIFCLFRHNFFFFLLFSGVWYDQK